MKQKFEWYILERGLLVSLFDIEDFNEEIVHGKLGYEVYSREDAIQKLSSLPKHLTHNKEFILIESYIFED